MKTETILIQNAWQIPLFWAIAYFGGIWLCSLIIALTLRGCYVFYKENLFKYWSCTENQKNLLTFLQALYLAGLLTILVNQI